MEQERQRESTYRLIRTNIPQSITVVLPSLSNSLILLKSKSISTQLGYPPILSSFNKLEGNNEFDKPSSAFVGITEERRV